jgi:hypothetical protein
MIFPEYKLYGPRIQRTYAVKAIGIILDTKLYFHHHVHYIFSEALELLSIISVITFSFLAVDSLFMSYLTLLRSELEYASVAWNSLTSTDASKLERVQRKFLSSCYKLFCFHIHYSYMNALEHTTFHTLWVRKS